MRTHVLALAAVLPGLLIAPRPLWSADPVRAAAELTPRHPGERGRFEVSTDHVIDVAFLPDGRRFLCATGLPIEGRVAVDSELVEAAERGQLNIQFASGSLRVSTEQVKRAKGVGRDKAGR